VTDDDKPTEGSTYFNRAQNDLEMIAQGRFARQSPHLLGGEPMDLGPLPQHLIDPSGDEPPLGPLEPGDLRSPVLGVALGGASPPPEPEPDPLAAHYASAAQTLAEYSNHLAELARVLATLDPLSNEAEQIRRDYEHLAIACASILGGPTP
jgi:hypothetical protein